MGYKLYGSNPASAGPSQAPWSTRALLSVCKWAEVISDTAGLGQCPRESLTPEITWINVSRDSLGLIFGWEIILVELRSFQALLTPRNMENAWLLAPICAKDATLYGHPPHRNPGIMAMGNSLLALDDPYAKANKPRLGPCHSCQTQP